MICVGSGKGGVGKSTVTTNLAAALQADGRQAAALDADVWGYSIPRMLGVHGRPKVSAERKILPLDGPAGVKAISIEHFLNERDQAITWRGPMLHKAIRQFLEDVDWGELDYLLIDLPPGTGDVSMTLAQLLPQARFVIVTTPQPGRQKVAARAADTARRFDLEMLGVVENMSGFTTPDGERFTIFGEGGGQQLADELDVPLLGKIPLQEELRVASATRGGRSCSRIPMRPPLRRSARRPRDHRRDAPGAGGLPAAVGPPVPADHGHRAADGVGDGPGCASPAPPTPRRSAGSCTTSTRVRGRDARARAAR